MKYADRRAGRLHDDDVRGLRLETVREEDRPIHHKDRARDDDDADVAVLEHRGRARMGRHARDLVRVLAVAQPFDRDIELERGKAGRIDHAAEGDADARAHAGLVRPRGGRGVDDGHDGAAAVAARDQGGQDRVAVAGAPLLGASAASVKVTGPPCRAASARACGQRNEFRQHLLVVGPEYVSEFQRQPPGLCPGRCQ